MTLFTIKQFIYIECATPRMFTNYRLPHITYKYENLKIKTKWY